MVKHIKPLQFFGSRDAALEDSNIKDFRPRPFTPDETPVPSVDDATPAIDEPTDGEAIEPTQDEPPAAAKD